MDEHPRGPRRPAHRRAHGRRVRDACRSDTQGTYSGIGLTVGAGRRAASSSRPRWRARRARRGSARATSSSGSTGSRGPAPVRALARADQGRDRARSSASRSGKRRGRGRDRASLVRPRDRRSADQRAPGHDARAEARLHPRVLVLRRRRRAARARRPPSSSSRARPGRSSTCATTRAGSSPRPCDVASVFIDDGIVCRTDGLHEETHEYRVTGVATHPGLPLVVLVNGGSASAAEIVAGALVDHERAMLVGERTYGKASVQSIAPLSDGGALKLTTAKYLTPAGADITGLGLEPSVVAADDPLTRRDEGLRSPARTLRRGPPQRLAMDDSSSASWPGRASSSSASRTSKAASPSSLDRKGAGDASVGDLVVVTSRPRPGRVVRVLGPAEPDRGRARGAALARGRAATARAASAAPAGRRARPRRPARPPSPSRSIPRRRRTSTTR